MAKPGSEELVLYAYTFFPTRAERVLWTLRELQLPHVVVRLDPEQGDTETETFLALNPGARVPVLVHGDRVLTESLPIMEYLNDVAQARDPATDSLVPRGIEANYEFRRLLHFATTEIEAHLWTADQSTRLHELYPWPDGAFEEALRQVQANLPLLWRPLELRPFAFGERFTLADIFVTHLLLWANTHGARGSADVKEYLARMRRRPAFPNEMWSN